MTEYPSAIKCGIRLRESWRKSVYPLEWLFAVAVPLSIVVPRSTPVVLFLLLFSMWAVTRSRNGGRVGGQKLDMAFVLLMLFSLWVAASALWSPVPKLSLGCAAQTALFAAASYLAFHLTSRFNAAEAWLIVRAAVLGATVAIAYLAIDLAMSEKIISTFFKYVRAVDPPTETPVLRPDQSTYYFGPVVFNRSIAVCSMLLWPALLWISNFDKARGLRRALFWTALAIIGCLIFSSSHTSSQVAFAVSVALFMASNINRRAVFVAMGLVWAGLALLIIPVSQSLDASELKNATWIKKSGKERFAIWSATAEQAKKTWPAGIGAGATPHRAADLGQASNINSHAHNSFLQVWFELGAVGAVLLALAGVCILMNMASRVTGHLFPYLAGQFGAFGVLFSVAYGVWQAWLIALYVLSVVLFAIAARAGEGFATENTLQDT